MNRQIPEMERLFKALADATRLRILGLLLTGEVCVCHIHESLKIPQSKASRHLAYLRRAGLVKRERNGRRIFYAFRTPTEGFARKVVADLLGHIDSAAFVRTDRRRLAGSRRP